MSFRTPPDSPPATIFDAWLHSGAPWQPLGVIHDAWRWTDATSAAWAAAVEWQQVLWQPWWDAQAEWLRQWGAAWPGGAAADRGAEQLA